MDIVALKVKAYNYSVRADIKVEGLDPKIEELIREIMRTSYLDALLDVERERFQAP